MSKTSSGSPSKRRRSSKSQKTEQATAAPPAAPSSSSAADTHVGGTEDAPSATTPTATTSALLFPPSKRPAGGGKKRKRNQPASPRRSKGTMSKDKPLEDATAAKAGAPQSGSASYAAVATTAPQQRSGDFALAMCTLLPVSVSVTGATPSSQPGSSDSPHPYGQKELPKRIDKPPTSGAPSRAEVAQSESGSAVSVPPEIAGEHSMPAPQSSPAPTKVLLLCPASSKDGKAVADSRNADAGSSSEIRTGKIESAVFSQRRETSVPNLKAMPRKSSLARRHSQTLSNTEKRAHFSEAPIIELVLLSLTQFSSTRKNAAMTLMAAAAASVTIVLAAILLYLSVHKDNEEDTPEPGGCTNADCRYHAALITNRLNLSLDPCHDFAAFACSAWTPPPTWLHREFPSARDDVVLAWARDFENILATGSR